MVEILSIFIDSVLKIGYTERVVIYHKYIRRRGDFPMIRHDYTFAPPHRITLSRPSASEKLLADINVQGISIAWSFQSLVNDVPLTWTNHPKDVTMFYGAYLDGEELTFTKWYRHESGAPYLFAEAEKEGFKMTVSAIACKTGVIIRTESESFGNLPRKLHVQFSHTNGWVISNQGWVDGKNNHVLLKMNGGRADRILAVGKGADDYLMYGLAGGTGEVPMANVKYGVKPHSMKKITSLILAIIMVVSLFSLVACKDKENETAKDFFSQYLENADIAQKERLPICQDTGFAVYFVELGTDVVLDKGTVYEALSAGTAAGNAREVVRVASDAET